MQTSCPKCKAPSFVVPGDQGRCAECGHTWMSDAADEAHTWELELQRAPGDVVQGPFDRLVLREMLYTGRLTGQELVRVPGATRFRPLVDVPELAEVLRLQGKLDQVKEPAPGERRITGWKASQDVKPKPVPVLPEAPKEAEPTKPFPVGMVLGGAVVVLLIIVAAFVGIMTAGG